MPLRIRRVKENKLKPPSPEHAACPCFGRAGETSLYESGHVRTCALLRGDCRVTPGKANWLTCTVVDESPVETIRQFAQTPAVFLVDGTEVSVTLAQLYRTWNGFDLPIEIATRRSAAKIKPHLYVIAQQL